MGRRPRDLELEQRWREVIASQKGSGLPVSRFCRVSRISEQSFYSWRRELAKRAAEGSRSGSPIFNLVQVLPSVALEVVMPQRHDRIHQQRIENDTISN